MSTRRRYPAIIAIALSLLVAPALSGCFGNPIENLIEGTTGGDVDLGGNSVPEDFPAEVPLIDGEVVFGLGLGDATGKVFNVSIKVSDANAIETIKGQLEDAGFTGTTEIEGTTLDGSTAMYSNANWGVLVVVTEESSTGFVANYTVTPAGN